MKRRRKIRDIVIAKFSPIFIYVYYVFVLEVFRVRKQHFRKKFLEIVLIISGPNL